MVSGAALQAVHNGMATLWWKPKYNPLTCTIIFFSYISRRFIRCTTKGWLAQRQPIKLIFSRSKHKVSGMTNNGIDNVSEVTLQDLVAFVWREKLLIILVAVFFTVAAAVVSVSIPNRYTAYTLLAPNSASSGADFSGVTGQLGGLAGLDRTRRRGRC